MGSKGPTGTGKTESIRDFANLCGIKLIVHNGSDRDTEESLAHLYDCCDATHSVCVDEFNRITSEVFSNESGKLMAPAKETENNK